MEKVSGRKSAASYKFPDVDTLIFSFSYLWYFVSKFTEFDAKRLFKYYCKYAEKKSGHDKEKKKEKEVSLLTELFEVIVLIRTLIYFFCTCRVRNSRKRKKIKVLRESEKKIRNRRDPLRKNRTKVRSRG